MNEETFDYLSVWREFNNNFTVPKIKDSDESEFWRAYKKAPLKRDSLQNANPCKEIGLGEPKACFLEPFKEVTEAKKSDEIKTLLADLRASICCSEDIAKQLEFISKIENRLT